MGCTNQRPAGLQQALQDPAKGARGFDANSRMWERGGVSSVHRDKAGLSRDFKVIPGEFTLNPEWTPWGMGVSLGFQKHRRPGARRIPQAMPSVAVTMCFTLVQHHIDRWPMLVFREREVSTRSVQPQRLCLIEGQVEQAKNTLNYHQFGVLYNFPAVQQWDLCPNDWHVPTDEEWTAMTSSLGSEVFAGGLQRWRLRNWWSSSSNGSNEVPGSSATSMSTAQRQSRSLMRVSGASE